MRSTFGNHSITTFYSDHGASFVKAIIYFDVLQFYVKEFLFLFLL